MNALFCEVSKEFSQARSRPKWTYIHTLFYYNIKAVKINFLISSFVYYAHSFFLHEKHPPTRHTKNNKIQENVHFSSLLMRALCVCLCIWLPTIHRRKKIIVFDFTLSSSYISFSHLLLLLFVKFQRCTSSKAVHTPGSIHTYTI